jgi:hypothetical protein
MQMQAMFPQFLPWQIFHALRISNYDRANATDILLHQFDSLPEIKRATSADHHQQLNKLESLYDSKVAKLAAQLPDLELESIRAMLTKCRGDVDLAFAQLTANDQYHIGELDDYYSDDYHTTDDSDYDEDDEVHEHRERQATRRIDMLARDRSLNWW